MSSEEKTRGNIYRGGPFYYIKDGMGNKKLALLYAIIIIFSFIGGFLTIQVNTVSKSINSIIDISPIIIGIIISLIAGITIFGGVKKIANVTEKLVPIVTLFYVIVCGYIIFTKSELIRPILSQIIESSFNFRAFGGGVITTLLIGMQKGIFSSEVGLGTGSIAAATADTKTAVDNGLVQIFGIHIENILFATITTFVVCMSGYASLVIGDPNRNRNNTILIQISHRRLGSNIHNNNNNTIRTSHSSCRILLWRI